MNDQQLLIMVNSIAESRGGWMAVGTNAGDFALQVAKEVRAWCAGTARETVCDTHIPTGIKIYGTVAAKRIMT